MKTITQYELLRLHALEQEMAALQAKLKKTKAAYEAVEQPVVQRLLEGDVVIEKGLLRVSLEWNRRRCPAYKEWIAKEHGQATVDRIIAATPVSESPYLELELVEVPR